MRSITQILRFPWIRPAFLLLPAIIAGHLHAATWYVDSVAKPSGADGTSWATAFPLLQDALHQEPNPALAPSSTGNMRLLPTSPMQDNGAGYDTNTGGTNYEVRQGGAVYLGAGSPRFRNCGFFGNRASSTALDPDSNLDGDPFTAIQEFAFDLDPNVADAWNDVHRTDFFPGLGVFLYFPLNFAAVHYVKVTGEWSYTLEPGSWMESVIYSGGNFGTLPGEFAARAPNLPTDTRGFVRLRFEP